ncbi:MAG: septum formation inhibitor Maf [Synergistaceae bacterium]|nr:septum formation inhibitor Maf [Synergistaceae bacterium]
MMILCSGSPRRKSLLESIGVKFETYRPEVDEAYNPPETPAEYCLRLARKKCEAGALKYPDDVIISADTIVVIDGKILGKPSDREDAVRMLASLSGREHTVITGLAVYSGGIIHSEAVNTLVKFRPLTKAEIISYVNTGESDDKAGGYAIQGKGSLLIEGIRGDYYNVMGLPLCTLYAILRAENINLL